MTSRAASAKRDHLDAHEQGSLAIAERPELCHVLRENPDLGEWISPRERERAGAWCVAPVITVGQGSWQSQNAALRVTDGGIGLLVLKGLLIRRIEVDRRCGAQLLGTGDLFIPRSHEDDHGTVAHTTDWRVVHPVRLAVLDRRTAQRFARYPMLTAAIAARAAAGSQWQAVTMAILHHPRIEVRVHMMLWHLADRWGHVGHEGIHLPMRLSHSLLGDLVAAHRPAVTASLKRLEQHGVIRTEDDGWLLREAPPPLQPRRAAAHPTQQQPITHGPP